MSSQPFRSSHATASPSVLNLKDTVSSASEYE